MFVGCTLYVIDKIISGRRAGVVYQRRQLHSSTQCISRSRSTPISGSFLSDSKLVWWKYKVTKIYLIQFSNLCNLTNGAIFSWKQRMPIHRDIGCQNSNYMAIFYNIIKYFSLKRSDMIYNCFEKSPMGKWILNLYC